MDTDDEMAKLEAELNGGEDDYCAQCELSLSAAELISKALSGQEKFIGLMPDEKLTDLDCKRFLTALQKGTNIEAVCLDDISMSPASTHAILDTIKKHPGVKGFSIGSKVISDVTIKDIVEILDTNRTVKQINCLGNDISPANMKLIVKSMERNRTVVSFMVSSKDEASLEKIYDYCDRNKSLAAAAFAAEGKRKAAATAAQSQQQTNKVVSTKTTTNIVKAAAAAAPISAVPTLTGGGNHPQPVLTLWFKGELHFGEAPPAEPGWVRLTFDQGSNFWGTQAAAAPSSTTTPTPPPPPESSSTVPEPKVLDSSPPQQQVKRKAAAAPFNTEKKVQALFDYEASDEDELSFKANDVIVVQKIIDEDWLLGKIGDVVGQVPRNYVQEIFNTI